MSPAERIRQLLDGLDAALLERAVPIRLGLLALLSGHHVLLLGPPGTAKSLLARHLARCFADARHFEYLLSRFTHPDELFGPVSIPGLKAEDYRRVTDGFLPRAHVAFLDEIFKANSAILNSLLALINERVFHHGRHRDPAPLLGLVGASNEPPEPDGGLDALYDRFLVRLAVGPLINEDAFLAVSLGQLPAFEPTPELKLTVDDVSSLQEQARALPPGPGVGAALLAIRRALGEAGLSASDRRWRWAVELLQMAALTAEREQIGPAELPLLEYCFGDPFEGRGAVRRAIREVLTRTVTVEATVAPLFSGWRAATAPAEPATGHRAALRRRRTQLDAFADRLSEADRALDAMRDGLRRDAERHLWLVEPPPELLAGFVAARQALHRLTVTATGHRARLAEHDIFALVFVDAAPAPSDRLERTLEHWVARRSWGHETRPIPLDAFVWVIGDDGGDGVPVYKDGTPLAHHADRVRQGQLTRLRHDEAYGADRRSAEALVDRWRAQRAAIHLGADRLDVALRVAQVHGRSAESLPAAVAGALGIDPALIGRPPWTGLLTRLGAAVAAPDHGLPAPPTLEA